METNKTQSHKEIEVRCVCSQLQIENRSSENSSRTIVGYAAKFDSWSEPILGWFKEKIARSAFEGCDLTDVIMCFNHNVDDILARTTSGTLTLSTDDVGLRFSFDAPNTTRGNDMLELVRRGDVSKCSFRFVVEKDEWRYQDGRSGDTELKYDERTILKFAMLKDVALVVFPAYKDTEASARHLEERKAEYLKTQEQEPQPQSEPLKTTHRTRTAQFTQLKK